jgi:hypothetical protein
MVVAVSAGVIVSEVALTLRWQAVPTTCGRRHDYCAPDARSIPRWCRRARRSTSNGVSRSLPTIAGTDEDAAGANLSHRAAVRRSRRLHYFSKTQLDSGRFEGTGVGRRSRSGARRPPQRARAVSSGAGPRNQLYLDEEAPVSGNLFVSFPIVDEPRP